MNAKIARRHNTTLPAMLALGLLAWLACPNSFSAESSGSSAPLPKIRIAAGGRTFQTADGKPFVPLGVNYYRPGTGWAPQLWKKFDPEATRRDFARMKELGVNCVRVFLSYGSFYMEPDSLEPEGLAKLDQFLSMAEAAGIYVHPTGPDHWEGVPRWAGRDRIADERVLAALDAFWKLLAARYRGRGVLFAYDLLNEPSVPWDTPAMRKKWNQWLESRYGTAQKAAAAWGVKPRRSRGEISRRPQPTTRRAIVACSIISTSARRWPTPGRAARWLRSRRPIPRPWSRWE